MQGNTARYCDNVVKYNTTVDNSTYVIYAEYELEFKITNSLPGSDWLVMGYLLWGYERKFTALW